MRHPRALVATGAILMAAAGGALYYRHTSSPEYALRKIERAVRNHDVVAFEKHVDVERTSASFVDQMVAFTAADLLRGSGDQKGLEAMGTVMGVQMMEGLKPAMVQALQAGLLRGVESGSVDSAFARPSEGFSSMGLGDSALQGLAGVRRNGSTAVADLRIRPEHLDTTLLVSAKMERVDGQWRVVGLNNFGAFLQTLDELQERRLAAVNDSASKRMLQLVEFGDMRRTPLRGRDTTYLLMEVPVRNRGTSPLTWAALVYPAGGANNVQVAMWDTIAPNAIGRATGGIVYSPSVPEQRALHDGATGTSNALTVGLAVLHGGKADTVYFFGNWDEYTSYMDRRSPSRAGSQQADAPRSKSQVVTSASKLSERLNGTWESDLGTARIDLASGVYSGAFMGEPFERRIKVLNEYDNVVVFKSDTSTIAALFLEDGRLMLKKQGQQGALPFVLRRVK